MSDSFYDQQDDLTDAKIEIYKLYIEGYLVKLLMTFGRCFIADLFCGPGEKGGEEGSPLVLIDRANYILTTPRLPSSKIFILFNDINEEYIKNLDELLKGIEIDKRIEIFDIEKKGFEEILPKVIKAFSNANIPKFFFLDPFTYSQIKIKDLDALMSLHQTEVLLFLPVFHSYRFASDKKLKLDHKTRQFIEEFTMDGISDYKNIDDFMNSIKEKVKTKLKLDFVRPILLDNGSRKNALFLLTKSQEGMLLMNKIAFKKSEDGKGINIKYKNHQTLFGIEGTDTFKQLEENLINELRNRKKMTSGSVIKFTIAEGFLPKDAKLIFRKLKKANRIKLLTFKGEETKQFYIAEKPNGISIFEYIT